MHYCGICIMQVREKGGKVTLLMLNNVHITFRIFLQLQSLTLREREREPAGDDEALHMQG